MAGAMVMDVTALSTSPTALVADALVAAAAGWYLEALLRLAERKERWPALRTASYLGGLALFFAVFGSAFSSYAAMDFPLHVVQHVVMMMAAPPLVVAGRPGELRRRLSDSASRLRAGSRRGLLGGLVVMGAYYGSMWVFFLTPLFAESMRTAVFEDAVNVVFIGLGVAYWRVVLREAATPQATHLKRVAATLVSMPIDMYLGFVLRGLGRSIGAGTTAASVGEGGEMFWWFTMLVCGISFAAVVVVWVLDSERAARRLDEELEGTEPEWVRPSCVEVGYVPSPSPSGQGGISLG